MLVVAILPIVVALVGLAMYVMASNTKTCEVGRCLFFAGVLTFLLAMSSETLRLRVG